MRKKRKNPVIRRARRSPYERSLEYATKRLGQAKAEWDECQVRIADLGREIPYLETVIRALTPTDTQLETIKRFKHKDYVVTLPIDPTGNPNGESLSQEDFLADRVPGQELLP